MATARLFLINVLIGDSGMRSPGSLVCICLICRQEDNCDEETRRQQQIPDFKSAKEAHCSVYPVFVAKFTDTDNDAFPTHPGQAADRRNSLYRTTRLIHVGASLNTLEDRPKCSPAG
ncbi:MULTISPECIES: hypothetical protein [unclassified Leisingera]|nr:MULTISPECIES: hypothetical protein [unclassified Leisingera]